MDARYPARVKLAALVAVAFLIAGCGGQPPTPQPTVPSTVGATPIASTSPVGVGTPGPTTNQCTHSEGGANANRCRGPIPAGTYTTFEFEPPLTYTVPEGWANWE